MQVSPLGEWKSMRKGTIFAEHAQFSDFGSSA
jgi:hypothetical protein